MLHCNHGCQDLVMFMSCFSHSLLLCISLGPINCRQQTLTSTLRGPVSVFTFLLHCCCLPSSHFPLKASRVVGPICCTYGGVGFSGPHIYCTYCVSHWQSPSTDHMSMLCRHIIYSNFYCANVSEIVFTTSRFFFQAKLAVNNDPATPDLLKGMLEQEPSQRLSAKDILR